MKNLKNIDDLMGIICEKPHYTAGIPIGIIAIDLEYPKLPGNVVNASTYDFPVLYEKVSFEIEALSRGITPKHIILTARYILRTRRRNA